ncbi:MAG: hypothetical protein AAF085_06845 [Planctomycetota bacterium]
MRLLTDSEYQQTMSAPMTPLDSESVPPFDFWDYFERIPAEDFQGFNCRAGEVERAWNGPAGHYQHVLVNSEKSNVFMVLILDLHRSCVHGHYLLDLNQEYGL